jgi:hypothetical protein
MTGYSPIGTKHFLDEDAILRFMDTLNQNLCPPIQKLFYLIIVNNHIISTKAI